MRFKLILLKILVLMFAALIAATAFASENERYKALPLGHGGASVFILDTKDGHMWVWTNLGAGHSAAGENANIRYEGNVRRHMEKDVKPLPKPAGSPANTPF